MKLNKFVLFILLCATYLHANNIKISAHKFYFENNITTLSKNVIIQTTDYNASSDKATYNKTSTDLNLQNNVKLNLQKQLQIKAKSLQANIKTKSLCMKDIELLHKDTDVWLNSNQTTLKDNIFNLKNTQMSSCEDKKNPLWKINFSDGSYNYKTQMIEFYNPTFYIKSLPLLWLPYINLQTGKIQKSGILPPSISLLKYQAYMQPFFIVLRENIDLEVTPFIYKDIGFGAYATIRFINSNTSQGKITLGKYTGKNAFNGIDFFYSKNIKDTKTDKEILIADIHHFDNASYLTHKTLNTLKLNIDNISTSYIKYFKQNNYMSFSLVTKDLKDINKKQNIQILPLLQLNKPSSYLSNNIAYKLNYVLQYDNRNNDKDLSPINHKIQIPILANSSLFNGFINMQIKNKTIFEVRDYFRKFKSVQDALYVDNDTKLELSTNLLKKYSNGLFHNINLSLKANNNKNIVKNDEYNLLAHIPNKANIEIENNLIKDNKIIFAQSLNQEAIISQKEKMLQLNKVSVDTKYITNQTILFNKIKYSNAKKEIIQNAIGFDYNDSIQKYNISYFYKNQDISNYMTLSSSFQINDDLSIGLKSDFDFNNNSFKRWGLFMQKDQDCWKYKINIGQSIIPKFTQDSTSYETNTILNVSLNFKPFAEISHNYYF